MDYKTKKEHTLPQLEYQLFERQIKSTQPQGFDSNAKDVDVLGEKDDNEELSPFMSEQINQLDSSNQVLGTTNPTDNNQDSDDKRADFSVLQNSLGNIATKIKDEFFMLAQALTNKVLHETDALFEAVKEDPVGRAGAEVQAYSQQGQKLDKDTMSSIVQRTVAHQKAASKNADIMFKGIQMSSRELGAKGYGYVGEGSAYLSQFREWIQKGFTPTDNNSERAEMEYYIRGLQGR